MFLFFFLSEPLLPITLVVLDTTFKLHEQTALTGSSAFSVNKKRRNGIVPYSWLKSVMYYNPILGVHFFITWLWSVRTKFQERMTRNLPLASFVPQVPSRFWAPATLQWSEDQVRKRLGRPTPCEFNGDISVKQKRYTSSGKQHKPATLTLAKLFQYKINRNTKVHSAWIYNRAAIIFSSSPQYLASFHTALFKSRN